MFFGLGAPGFEFLLQRGELLLGHGRILRSRRVLLGQGLGFLLRFAERGGELGLFGLELRKVLVVLLERGLGGLKLLGDLHARRLLVGQGLLHHFNQILVGRGRVVRGNLRDRGPALVHRLRLFPSRERDEVEKEKINDDEKERLVHDAKSEGMAGG